MKKIKLYRTLIDETWFLGERWNPKKWQQSPIEWTNWNEDFEEEIETYNKAQSNLKEYQADAVEIRFCFIEVDEQDFLNQAGFDEEHLNLDNEEMQEALDYYVDFNWTEVAIKIIENPLFNDGEIMDVTYRIS